MRDLSRDALLITDATSDLGRALVYAAVRAGARRIYAGGAHAHDWASDRVVPVTLDATSSASVRHLSQDLHDVTLVITTSSSPAWPPVAVGNGDVSLLAEHLDATVLSAVRVAAAFAPTLARNGGGVIACVVSVQAWVNLSGAYAVAQAALASAVDALRIELRHADVHVLAAIGGLVEAQRPSTQDAAERILLGIRTRAYEVILDDYTAAARSRLSGPIEGIYPELA